MNDTGSSKYLLENSLSYDFATNRLSADYYNGLRVLFKLAHRGLANNFALQKKQKQRF